MLYAVEKVDVIEASAPPPGQCDSKFVRPVVDAAVYTGALPVFPGTLQHLNPLSSLRTPPTA